MSDGEFAETLMPINVVLLCTISGIIGLVLTGFTGWHLSLAWRNQTTIECLEKTRYLSPLRKSMRRQQNGVREQSYGRRLAEIHANAIPGATRDEEGEEMRPNPHKGMDHSPAHRALQMNYTEMEQERERERYEEYLDEQDSEKLPNAFDLGWRRNLIHLFGEKPLYWFLPFCNTVGDGWHWEPSQDWLEAREELKKQRESQWNQHHQVGDRYDSRHAAQTAGQVRDVPSDSYFDSHGDNDSTSSKMSLKTLRRRESFEDGNQSDDVDDYDSSSDDEEDRPSSLRDGLFRPTEPMSHGNGQGNGKKLA
ncbi:MAG: hypothetical protein LQ352_007645 [Teloschistes flavicans]|nr:MAG: hypothetical protein LQ352_007645 [Teloschistes flavicans]